MLSMKQHSLLHFTSLAHLGSAGRHPALRPCALKRMKLFLPGVHFFIFFLFSFFHSARLSAQDIHFSQFYEVAPLRNPALTGIFSGDYKATLNYRNQWSTLAVPFVTTVGAVEVKLPARRREARDFWAFAIVTSYDQAGSIRFNSSSTYAMVNYSKAFGEERPTYLSVGGGGGYIQRSVDRSRMVFANQYSGVTGPPVGAGETVVRTQVQHFDAAAGISLNGSLGARTNYYLGGGAFHLAEPAAAFAASGPGGRLSTRYTAQVGVKTAMGAHTALTIHANYQNQDPHTEWTAGFLLGLSGRTPAGASGGAAPVTVSAGAFCRWGDALVPTVKVEYRSWTLTASYDAAYNGRRIYMAGMGGTEITLAARGRYRKSYDPTDALQCTRFEDLSPGN